MNVRHLAARIPQTGGSPSGASPLPHAPGNPAPFADALQRASERSGDQGDELKLSAHAERRLQTRHISLDADQRQSIQDALRLLDAKGAREALLIRSDATFVVNVPSRTIVTAVSPDEMRERVFTQIDSAFML